MMNAVQNLLRPSRRGSGAEAAWRRLGLQDSPVLGIQGVSCWLRRAAVYQDLAAHPPRAAQPESCPEAPVEPPASCPEVSSEISMGLALKTLREAAAEPVPCAKVGTR